MLNEVWFHLIRLVPLHAHYVVVVQSSEMYLFCLIVRFSNMGIEWGGYHLHLLFEVLLYSLSVLRWCLSLCSWMPLNSHRCLRKRTSVVRRSYFVCHMSPYFLDVVTFMTFPLVLILRKGPLHLEQRIYDFVLFGLWTFLPPLLYLVTTKLLRILICISCNW